MNKKILLPLVLLFLLLGGAPAAAQHLQLKVGGGLASHFGDSRPVGSYKIGVGYEYEFDQHWSISPALFYYGKGWKDPDQRVFVFDDKGAQQFDDEGNPLTSIKNCTSSAQYITLPVLFNYYLRTGESRYVVFSAGPYVAYGVRGKMRTKGDAEKPGSQKLFYSTDTFKEPGAHRFEAGVEVAVGYQFSNGITVGLETDLGLTHFNKAGGRNVSGLIAFTYTFKNK